MSSTETGAGLDLTVRLARPEDADPLADLHNAARRAAVPSMPPGVHTDEETHTWMGGRLGSSHEVWVAERDERLIGYLALTRSGEAWLDDLYVAPGHTGMGVGSVLLDLAKSLRPDGFALWVFETNQGARRFYRRHGLVELERTDGCGNEEGAPDLQMAWPGRDPVSYFRRRIDGVDDELATVIARRAALTAVVQRYKPVPGHAGRDDARETEIAARMATRAPGLPVEGWRRILHEVISVSIDAAEGP